MGCVQPPTKIAAEKHKEAVCWQSNSYFPSKWFKKKWETVSVCHPRSGGGSGVQISLSKSKISFQNERGRESRTNKTGKEEIIYKVGERSNSVFVCWTVPNMAPEGLELNSCPDAVECSDGDG